MAGKQDANVPEKGRSAVSLRCLELRRGRKEDDPKVGGSKAGKCLLDYRVVT